MVLLGVIVAVLLGLSFVALGLFAVAGLAAVVATMRAARRDRQLANELDGVLDEIVGPRTPSSSTSLR